MNCRSRPSASKARCDEVQEVRAEPPGMATTGRTAGAIHLKYGSETVDIV
jgi:hypothetical protein